METMSSEHFLEMLRRSCIYMNTGTNLQRHESLMADAKRV